MKYFNCLCLLLLCNCTSPTNNATTNVDSKREIYSSAFESIKYDKERRLKSKLVVTLGQERLPEEYYIDEEPIQNGKLSKQDRQNGLIEAVTEIILTNESNEILKIELMSLKVNSKTKKFNNRHEQVITPNQHIKIPPFVELGSTNNTNGYSYTLELKMNGQIQQFRGVARRKKIK